MTEWKEAKNGEVVKLDENESLQGKFISLERSKLYNDSFAFSVENEQGIVSTFVNNIVVELVERNNIVKGQLVKLTYLGMKENESRTRSYKNYQLLFQ